MAYTTYTTKALVCGTYNRNTADRSYLMFTREAGMLYADARSAREERSRQRYALQEFSLVRVSLIKGKVSWKVGSIEALKNYYHESIDKEARGSVVSLSRLLRRFVKGEEPAPELFDYVMAAFDELSSASKERPFIQTTVQVQILAHLGYVDTKSVPETIRGSRPADIAAQYTSGIEKQVNSLYAHAVSISHL
ncbi:MAG: recombination protein O N-terminal domain-containing protein [Candidatus Pacebacteria bacterium]|nr:recombination protein O N-terminal domain-containing protein [Candidatus Paceibacterota bacterium]